MQKFAYNNKPVSMPTILDRMRRFPSGMSDENKPQQAGAKPSFYAKWEQTPTYKLIMEKIGVDKNSVKAKLRNPEKYSETFKLQGKYLQSCLLAWRALGCKKDVFDLNEDDWLVVWGKNPKVAGTCHPFLRDNETGLVNYGYSTGLRWAMKHSRDPRVANFIVTDDPRFNTKGLKREAGKHKKSYFTEEQCLMFPQAISKVDTLFLSYFGKLFGGRFSALSDITPEHFDYAANKLIVFETKVQRNVEKQIFEPENTFIKQYIMDMGIKLKEPLFKRSIAEYNKELSATKDWFKNTDYPLYWTPTTHTAFKHTCVTQMSLHGVRMDTISDYIGTDPNTLKQFYRGGSEENIRVEIGGEVIKQQAASWRAFVIQLSINYAKRYEELTGRKVVLPNIRRA
jgi:hypothetical protein